MDKIRILYICIDSSLGGSTSSLYNLIDGLREYVDPIVLFPERGEGYEFFSQNGIESHLYPFIKLYDFKTNKFGEVWKCPWNWHYIKKLRRDISCYRYVKQFLGARKVDIVHTNTSPNDIGVLLSFMLRAKHIWHVRESGDYFEIYGGIIRLRKLINQADARIAISTAIKNYWQMPDRNTWIINDAIREKQEACYIQKKEKYLLFSAYNLTEFKGTRFAIKAFSLSGLAQEGYRLKLMGNCDEDYYKSLLDTAIEYDVVDNIDFVSYQMNVKPYYTHATAYILASQFEGLGRVTAEAMFYGCPVIARATGGTLDIVRNGETGYLFNTIEECAQLICKAVKEDQKRLILRAQDFAVNNLSQEVYAPKIREVYKSVLCR